MLAVLLLAAAAEPLSAQGSALARPFDPVVIAGDALPAYAGAEVNRVVGFRWDTGSVPPAPTGQWVQIPVQLDERLEVAFQIVYGPAFIVGSSATTIGYADPTTYTGPDFDPRIDADDELVFMAKEAGARVSGCYLAPPGTLAGSGLEVELTDPLDSSRGWVYLFLSDAGLDPAAGQDAIQYEFNPLSGNYLATYNTFEGPNPEDSEVVTGFYRVHFADRWIRDEIHISAGGASGVDVLDRHKFLFSPGACGRTEDTFSEGEGAFIANVDGPVRAIRSYIGANSGPMTERGHFFYAQREDVTTHIRVHALNIGGMDLLDLAPEAAGMVYADDRNQTPVMIDGVPDVVQNGTLTWQLITGFQGSLLISLRNETDIPVFKPTSYYSDRLDPPQHQCTGDTFEYGVNGQWITHNLPNTDPRFSPLYCLQELRTIYFEGPGQDTATAALRAMQAERPLLCAVSPFVPQPAVLAYCSAKINSLGCLPGILSTGQPSAEEDHGFVVKAANVRNNKNGLLFYSVSGRAATPFQGGTLCVSVPVRRTPGVGSGGNPSPANDCSGEFAIDMNTFAMGLAGGHPLPDLGVTGTVVSCQWWGRDPGFPAPNNTTLTGGLEYIIGCADACPDDPLKVLPGACGCGVPDTDSDGDGTADCLDLCPADPLKIAPGACGCGVADTDTDGDGIPDCLDNCDSLPNPGQGDCDGNGVGDACEISQGAPDCNLNGVPDACDIANGTSQDVNGNGIPDECEL
jgi:hypothetical protein